MADGPKDEAVVLRLDDFLMADTQSQPVADGLFDSKGKALSAFASLYSWLHDGEFIA
jgi:hypothetical protein